MDLNLEENLQNNLENNQNNFLNSTLGNIINNAVDFGIRYFLPDYAEDKVIEVKDNLLNYGLKEGISKTIQSVIDTGKSIAGIVTGNFENINQINEVIKSGGIIDSTSDLLDDVLNKVADSGKVNSNIISLLSNGKDLILNNVEKNVESLLEKQTSTSQNIEQHMDNWQDYFNAKDFYGMEKEYVEIENELTELVPIENTINNARKIETIHNLIKNNGQNFNLTNEELELVEKLSNNY